MHLTTEQVLALAPDASSASAGRKLADARQWRGLARDAAALWGECQGSALYQVRIDLGDLVAKCSCPSRKFPCKHSIALLLLAVQSEAAFTASARPQWVSEWLDKRSAAAEAKEKRVTAPAKPVDEAAQARRTEKREERVSEGVASLDLWMADLVRNGLGSIEPHSREWDARAARLVDAQAPALASRIRRIGGLVGSRPEWPLDVLEELGKTALLTEAWRNIDSLPPPLQADVRQLIGWTFTQEEVLAAGDIVSDSWFVIGNVTEDDERFRLQRSWLQGQTTQRLAMILQFAAGPASFPELIAAGSSFDAELAFWPGAQPTRALIIERRPNSTRAPLVRLDGLDALADRFSTLLAAQPWTERTAALLHATAIDPGSPFRAIDRHGRAVPLAPGEHWTLAALSGGQPIDLAAEWNGRALAPLGVLAGHRYHLLQAN